MFGIRSLDSFKKAIDKINFSDFCGGRAFDIQNLGTVSTRIRFCFFLLHVLYPDKLNKLLLYLFGLFDQYSNIDIYWHLGYALGFFM